MSNHSNTTSKSRSTRKTKAQILAEEQERQRIAQEEAKKLAESELEEKKAQEAEQQRLQELNKIPPNPQSVSHIFKQTFPVFCSEPAAEEEEKQHCFINLNQSLNLNLSRQTQLSQPIKSTKQLNNRSRKSLESLKHTKSEPCSKKFNEMNPAEQQRLVELAYMQPHHIAHNQAILNRMRHRVDFLKNPRYSANHYKLNKQNSLSESNHYADATQRLAAILNDADSQASNINVTPRIVLFKQYESNNSYHQEITIKNIGIHSKRIKIIPPSANNTIYSISEPRYSNDSGTLAPGLDCRITVYFNPIFVRDYYDSVTVLTDSGRIIIPLYAVRENPRLTLPYSINAGVCSNIANTSYSYSCANVGNHGKFWVLPKMAVPIDNTSNKNSNRNYTTQEFLQYLFSIEQEFNNTNNTEIDCFVISPAHFSLAKNEEIDLNIQFNAAQEATNIIQVHQNSDLKVYRSEFVIVCDNFTVVDYELIGKTCSSALQLTQINEVSLENPIGLFPFSEDEENRAVSHTLIFEAAYVRYQQTQEIVVNNPTPLSIPFRFASTSQNTCFLVAPSSGVFSPHSSQQFFIHFIPKPSDSLLVMDLVQLYAGDSRMLELELQGVVQLPQIGCSPHALHYGADLLVNKEYPQTLVLSNDSPVVVNLQVNSIETDFYSITPSHSHISIPPNSSAQMCINLSSSSPHSIQAQVAFRHLNSSQVFSVPISASFVGARVSLRCAIGPRLDYGLVNVGLPDRVYSQQLLLRNDSPIEVNFALCESGYSPALYLSHSTPNKYSTSDYSSHFRFSPFRGVIPAMSTVEVAVAFSPSTLGLYQSSLELHTQYNSTPECVSVIAQVIAPSLHISPAKLNLDLQLQNSKNELSSTPTVFLNQPRQFEVRIENISQLAARYQWRLLARRVYSNNSVRSEVHSQLIAAELNTEDYRFEYSSGELGDILANNSATASFRFTPYIADYYHFYVELQILSPNDCIDSLLPSVGFEFECTAVGLTVSAHHYNHATSLAYESAQKQLDELILSSAENYKNSFEAENRLLEQRLRLLDAVFPNHDDLIQLKFDNIPLFKKKELQFALRNHTAIPAEYHVTLHNYNPNQSVARLIKHSANMNSSAATSHRSLVSVSESYYASTVYSLSKANLKKPLKTHRYLRRKGDSSQQFKSSSGQAYSLENHEKSFADAIIPTHQGVAFSLKINNKSVKSSRVYSLEPYSVTIVSLVIYCNQAGAYDDSIQVTIHNSAEHITIPVQALVAGSPLRFSRNNLGISYSPSAAFQNDFPSLHFGSPTAGRGAEVSRKIRVDNSGPIDIKILWHLYDLNKAQSDNLLDIHIDAAAEDSSSSADAATLVERGSVLSTQITRHLITEADESFPFSLEHKELIVPARSHSSFIINFSLNSSCPFSQGWLQGELFIHNQAPNVISHIAQSPHLSCKHNLSTRSFDSQENNEAADSEEESLGSANCCPPHLSQQIEEFEANLARLNKSNNKGESEAEENTSRPSSVAGDVAGSDSSHAWIPAGVALRHEAFGLNLQGSVDFPQLSIDLEADTDTDTHEVADSTVYSVRFSVPAHQLDRNDKFIQTIPLVNNTNTELDFTITSEPAQFFQFLLKQLDQQPTALQNALNSARSVDRPAFLSGGSSSRSDKSHIIKQIQSTIKLPHKTTLENTKNIQMKPTAKLEQQRRSHHSFSLKPQQQLALPLQFVPTKTMEYPSSQIDGKLIIEYSNGTEQVISLQALILRPALLINANFHHFGLVHVVDVYTNLNLAAMDWSNGSRGRKYLHNRNQQEFQLEIFNPSSVECIWRINNPSASTVFIVPSQSSTLQPKAKQLINILFQPTQPIHYSADFQLEILNNPSAPILPFTLTGQGSMAENL
jgi:hypothetical protein